MTREEAERVLESMRIDIPPGNDSVRASTGFQRDGGDKTERRGMANQCVHCGQEMPEGDQVCKACRDGNSKNGAIVKRKSALAENLRQILSNEDITVAMLAEWSNVSVHTIKGWLYLDRVARKNSTSLKRVADVLRVGVEELRGRKAPEVEL